MNEPTYNQQAMYETEALSKLFIGLAKDGYLAINMKLVIDLIERDVPDTRPCDTCQAVLLDADTYKEELGFCVECQHAYFEEGNAN
jgi:hypothetical protein